MTCVRVIRNPTDPPDIDLTFPLTRSEGHDAVNTAVTNALFQITGGKIIEYKSMNGVSSYMFLYKNICLQILVVRVSEYIASFQQNIVGYVTDGELNEMTEQEFFTPEVIHTLTSILQAVFDTVSSHLRKIYTIDELKPPPPPYDDHVSLFLYQRIYFPNLTDEEFGLRINVPVQTLRNWRSQAGMSSRMFRPATIDWSKIQLGVTPLEDLPWGKDILKRERYQSRGRQD